MSQGGLKNILLKTRESKGGPVDIGGSTLQRELMARMNESVCGKAFSKEIQAQGFTMLITAESIENRRVISKHLTILTEVFEITKESNRLENVGSFPENSKFPNTYSVREIPKQIEKYFDRFNPAHQEKWARYFNHVLGGITLETENSAISVIHLGGTLRKMYNKFTVSGKNPVYYFKEGVIEIQVLNPGDGIVCPPSIKIVTGKTKGGDLILQSVKYPYHAGELDKLTDHPVSNLNLSEYNDLRKKLQEKGEKPGFLGTDVTAKAMIDPKNAEFVAGLDRQDKEFNPEKPYLFNIVTDGSGFSKSAQYFKDNPSICQAIFGFQNDFAYSMLAQIANTVCEKNTNLNVKMYQQLMEGDGGYVFFESSKFDSTFQCEIQRGIELIKELNNRLFGTFPDSFITNKKLNYQEFEAEKNIFIENFTAKIFSSNKNKNKNKSLNPFSRDLLGKIIDTARAVKREKPDLVIGFRAGASGHSVDVKDEEYLTSVPIQNKTWRGEKTGGCQNIEIETDNVPIPVFQGAAERLQSSEKMLQNQTEFAVNEILSTLRILKAAIKNISPSLDTLNKLESSTNQKLFSKLNQYISQPPFSKMIVKIAGNLSLLNSPFLKKSTELVTGLSQLLEIIHNCFIQNDQIKTNQTPDIMDILDRIDKIGDLIIARDYVIYDKKTIFQILQGISNESIDYCLAGNGTIFNQFQGHIDILTKERAGVIAEINNSNNQESNLIEINTLQIEEVKLSQQIDFVNEIRLRLGDFEFQEKILDILSKKAGLVLDQVMENLSRTNLDEIKNLEKTGDTFNSVIIAGTNKQKGSDVICYNISAEFLEKFQNSMNKQVTAILISVCKQINKQIYEDVEANNVTIISDDYILKAVEGAQFNVGGIVMYLIR